MGWKKAKEKNSDTGIKLKLRLTNKIRASASESQQSAYAKTKTQISCAVTAQLIRAFVFRSIDSTMLHLTKSEISCSYFLCLYRWVCVNPDQKTRLLVFSCVGIF